MFSTQKEFAVFMFFREVISFATAVYRTDLFKQIPFEFEKFSKFFDWPFMVKFGGFGKIALLADTNAFHVRRHDRQATWTYTDTPSFQQILNWDKFFFDVFFRKRDSFLEKTYSRKATYFYIGKYNAFVPAEQKKEFSESDLRSMAVSNGLRCFDENLLSKETYDAWLQLFSEKRLRPLSGRKQTFRHILKLHLRVLKRFIKHDFANRKTPNMEATC